MSASGSFTGGSGMVSGPSGVPIPRGVQHTDADDQQNPTYSSIPDAQNSHLQYRVAQSRQVGVAVWAWSWVCTCGHVYVIIAWVCTCVSGCVPACACVIMWVCTCNYVGVYLRVGTCDSVYLYWHVFV